MVLDNLFNLDITKTLDEVIRVIKTNISKMGEKAPEIGKSDFTYERCTNNSWVTGFWSGELWLCYMDTGDPIFLDAAKKQRSYFENRLKMIDTLDHDVGFLYMPSVVFDYKITNDVKAREIGLVAAKFLLNRFNKTGNFIQAWNEGTYHLKGKVWKNENRVIIDTMMNLTLLYWAANETGIIDYYNIANAHAYTTMNYMIREDGSTYHTYIFNPLTGAPLIGETYQGYSNESCWSRGQGWAILGFALAYNYTGDIEFLKCACHLVKYVLNILPSMEYMPYWDYKLPEGTLKYIDTSAAAITADALLLLNDITKKSELFKLFYNEQYLSISIKIIKKLISNYFLPFKTKSAEGFLSHGVANVRLGLINNMLPYGDYFFLESIFRLLGKRYNPWEPNNIV